MFGSRRVCKRTRSHPYSPFKTRWTKKSEAWSPMTFIDKFDITGRTAQILLAHIFRPHGAPNQEGNSNIFWIHGNRGISETESYSCPCSTSLKMRDLAMSSDVWENARRSYRTCNATLVLSLVLRWTWTSKSVVPCEVGQTGRTMGIASTVR